MTATNLFRLEELKPHFEAQLAALDEDLAEFKRHFDTNPMYALERCENLFEVAAHQHTLKAIWEWCQRTAEANAGAVDYDEIDKLLRDRLVSEARSSSRSTSETSNMMKRAEITVLAKADEPWTTSVLHPFQKVLWERQSAAYKAKIEAASYRIANRSGKKWRTQANDGWTTKVENAGLWSYADRPAIATDIGEKYEMVETATA